MTSKQKPIVIAIAAVSGGGKTTITMQLNKALNNSKALFFDDYESDDYPNDICDWVENGADYNKWKLTPLINDVQLLLSDTNQHLEYILLDYPFAYQQQEMGQLINLAVFIDTPLDIAMCRRILRDFTQTPIDNLSLNIKYYLSRSRMAYLEMLKTIKPNSDIVIDGTLPISTIVNKILALL